MADYNVVNATGDIIEEVNAGDDDLLEGVTLGLTLTDAELEALVAAGEGLVLVFPADTDYLTFALAASNLVVAAASFEVTADPELETEDFEEQTALFLDIDTALTQIAGGLASYIGADGEIAEAVLVEIDGTESLVDPTVGSVMAVLSGSDPALIAVNSSDEDKRKLSKVLTHGQLPGDVAA